MQSPLFYNRTIPSFPLISLQCPRFSYAPFCLLCEFHRCQYIMTNHTLLMKVESYLSCRRTEASAVQQDPCFLLMWSEVSSSSALPRLSIRAAIGPGSLNTSCCNLFYLVPRLQLMALISVQNLFCNRSYSPAGLGVSWIGLVGWSEFEIFFFKVRS